MEYLKINSLWKREDYIKGGTKGKHGPLIEGQYSEPEFGNIKRWHVEEKIDGTNVRVMYKEGKVCFGGRTDDSQMPVSLMFYLQETFTEYSLSKAFASVVDLSYPNVILFGEGYGPKIQAGGGNYRKDVGFILFDVLVGDWWLQRSAVKDIADKLSIPMCPALFDEPKTEQEIVEFVKSKPMSKASIIPQMMEGVVCRSEPLMLFRNKKPIMFKLKCKEFI